MSNNMFDRRISKHEKRKLAIWVVLGFFVMALSFSAIFTSYMVNQRVMSTFNLKAFSIIDFSNYQRKNNRGASGHLKTGTPVEKAIRHVPMMRSGPLPSVICNFSHPRSDICEITGEARIRGNSSVVVASSSYYAEAKNTGSWKIKPYARKIDRYVMTKVREVSIRSASSLGPDEMPQCSINHTVPAIVFSTGGYASNVFHSFTDIIIPLYITSRRFKGEVQFVVTDINPKWLLKYRAILASLSKHVIIDVDSTSGVHCFPRMIVGLRSHKEFGIDPYQDPYVYTMVNFTEFARNVYSLKRSKVERLGVDGFKRPRLMIISRKGSRALLNEDKVAEEARRLGYDVFVTQAGGDIREFSRKLNSFDVVVGVHGAGLTNSVFLPENAVVIQIVPLGLNWLAKQDFKLPQIAMNLKYLEYVISGNESSLADKYSLEDPIIQKPSINILKPPTWAAFKKIYIDGQNVRVDVGRFRQPLLKALELLRQ